MRRPTAVLGLLLLLSDPGRADTPAAAGPRGEAVSRLMRSSVCVLGDVPGGKLEASGFVVSPGDSILTTAHGIDRAVNLRVKAADGRVFPARIDRIGTERADIALLMIVGPRLEPVTLGSLGDVQVGDAVLTIGCPSGFEFTVSQGVVSSLRPSDFGYPLIQSDVPVNPGSSGGPLFAASGQVVGIIKSGASKRDRINFALPIDLGKALLEDVGRQRKAYELFNQAVLAARLEEKVTLYRQAIAAEPGLIEGHYNLGLALERLGRKEEAEKEYRAALALRPEYSAASLNLGATLYERGRFDEAIAVYRAALRLDPDSVALRNNIAEAYRAQGKANEARAAFEAILAKNPEYAPAHYGLALLYDDGLRDRKRAAEHYRRYLALAPEANDAEKVRDWLRQSEDRK